MNIFRELSVMTIHKCPICGGIGKCSVCNNTGLVHVVAPNETFLSKFVSPELNKHPRAVMIHQIAAIIQIA